MWFSHIIVMMMTMLVDPSNFLMMSHHWSMKVLIGMSVMTGVNLGYQKYSQYSCTCKLKSHKIRQKSRILDWRLFSEPTLSSISLIQDARLFDDNLSSRDQRLTSFRKIHLYITLQRSILSNATSDSFVIFIVSVA